MRVAKKIMALAMIAGISVLASTSASARGWWNSDNDYWDGWGYPGYGWDGYPGYGWGRYPSRIEIYTQSEGAGESRGARSPQSYSVE